MSEEIGTGVYNGPFFFFFSFAFQLNLLYYFFSGKVVFYGIKVSFFLLKLQNELYFFLRWKTDLQFQENDTFRQFGIYLP